MPPLAITATILVIYLIVSSYERSGAGPATGSSTAHHGGSQSGAATRRTSHKRATAKKKGGPPRHRRSPLSTSGTSTSGTSTRGTSTSAATTSTTATTTTGTSTTGPGAKFYIVQPGDTMEIISAKTHVPLATLEALNPRVSSNAMSVGQRLRIRK